MKTNDQTTNNNQNQEKGFLKNNQKDIKDLIAPSGIDATSTNHLEIFGDTNRYARTLMVSALPRMCTFPELFRDMYFFGDINTSIYIKPIQEAKNFTSNTSIAVIISDIHIFTTKNHKTMATIKCYDNTSLLSATLFSDVYEKEKIKITAYDKISGIIKEGDNGKQSHESE